MQAKLYYHKYYGIGKIGRFSISKYEISKYKKYNNF